jgi:signal transduction histidine kinase
MRLIRILAKQIQGTVEIQSEPGKGFLANISLPG